MTLFRLALLASLALSACLLPALRPANATETFETCTGFINSVPAVIGTQGVWCLDRNLSTSIAAGNAINISTNNVTLDCNGFKLGGLGAGNGSKAYGIVAYSRHGVTVRNCSVRGFHHGIRIIGGAGHVVEDNRLDNNLYTGLQAIGDNVMVRRNRIYDTGGATGGKWTYGIHADASIIDNIVSGLFADQPGGYLRGISVSQDGVTVSGNVVGGFDMIAAQGGEVDYGTGMFVVGQYVLVSNNHLAGTGAMGGGSGIAVNGGSKVFCKDNTVGGFTYGLSQCSTSEGNLTLP